MVIFSHSCDIFQTLEDGNSMICILHSNHFPLSKIEKRKKGVSLLKYEEGCLKTQFIVKEAIFSKSCVWIFFPCRELILLIMDKIYNQ